MLIQKYQNPWQKLRYSKGYRLPQWLYRKMIYKKALATTSVRVKMRLGHVIELKPTCPYLKRVIINRAYHDDDVFSLSQFIERGAVILDIGANIGLFSCAYAHYYRDLAPTLYAIEAIQSNFLQLNKNIEINKLTNVYAERLAFGNHNGSLKFSLPSSDFIGNAVSDSIIGSKNASAHLKNNPYTEEVPMQTLDYWVQTKDLKRCDFIKIDIEGAELSVLRGGLNFLKATRPIIQCEFNKYFVEQQGLRINDFYDFFTHLEYKCFIEDGHYFRPFELSTFNSSLVDLLLIPKSKIKKNV